MTLDDLAQHELKNVREVRAVNGNVTRSFLISPRKLSRRVTGGCEEEHNGRMS